MSKPSRKLSRVGLALAGMFPVAAAGYLLERWERARSRELAGRSRLVDTPRGIVEYGETGEGPVLVAFHGTPGGFDQAAVLRNLARRGFMILCPSRPGYLRTPLDTGRSAEDQARAMAAWMDTLGVRSAPVVAISGGGPVALEFARIFPGKCRALVLLSALSCDLPVADHFSRIPLAGLALHRLVQSPVQFLAFQSLRILPQPLLALMAGATTTARKPDEIRRLIRIVTDDPEAMEMLRALYRSIIPVRSRIAGIRNDLANFSRRPMIPTPDLPMPSLIVHSRLDGEVPFSNAEFIQRHAHNGELLAVDGWGHYAPLFGEEAHLIENRVADFCRQHAS